MDEQIILTAKPTIKEVRQRFERWRASKQHRTATIPVSLWEGAVTRSFAFPRLIGKPGIAPRLFDASMS